jgi:hypothetical protein
LAASGPSSQLAASGHSSKLAASGPSSKLECTGASGVVAAVGPGTSVRGVAGTHIALADYDHNGKPIGFVTGVVGENGLEPNTYYAARGGAFVKVAG